MSLRFKTVSIQHASEVNANIVKLCHVCLFSYKKCFISLPHTKLLNAKHSNAQTTILLNARVYHFIDLKRLLKT